MTISEQLTFIAEQLKPWANDTKTRVEIAADPVHLLGLLATSPGAARVVVMFDAEEKRGDYEELGRVDRKFLVVVSRGRGFALEPEQSLVEGVAGGRPLYRLVEEAREMIRAMRFSPETTESLPNYLATRRLQVEEAAVDAYQIEFQIGVQLPLEQPGEEDPQPPDDGDGECQAETPIPLGINYELDGPNNYRLRWSVTRAPLVGFILHFGDTQGGPYLTETIPPQSGICSYTWLTNGNEPLTPIAAAHQDMYLVVTFDDGDGCTADSEELHGVWAPS